LFFCPDSPAPALYPLSLRDALPISQPVSVEGPREEVVDRDVVADGLAREPRDEAREPGARPVREPQDVDGVLHGARRDIDDAARSEEHTSELQSRGHLVCRLLLDKK